MATEIPLFPLRTVLFPGQDLPLRIFEDRYRQMVNELLRDGGEFGVLLIKSGNEVGGGAIPHGVGTTAAITECQELPGGRFMLEARGGRRFRLLEMLPPRPYPFGIVEFIDDEASIQDPRTAAAMETVRATFPVYLRMALALTDQWARGLKLPRDPHGLVNFLAQWLQTDEEARQRLLELEHAADRLGLLAEQLDDLIARTRHQLQEHRREKFGSLGAAN